MRKAAPLLAAASLTAAVASMALPGTAEARVFVGVGFGFAPAPVFVAPAPVFVAPPPYYYAPPYYPSPYYAPPPAVSYAPYAPAPYLGTPTGSASGTVCATARFSCPMSRPGILGGSCSCPTNAGGQASGIIR